MWQGPAAVAMFKEAIMEEETDATATLVYRYGRVLVRGGLSVESEVIEYREGGDNGLVRKLPGARKYSNIVLKRGFVPGEILRNWIWTNLAPDGTVDRRDGAVVLRDRAGKEAARYEFFDAWPCKWSGFTPEESSDGAFVEEIVICVDYFREVLPGGG